jgi:ABC-2 type transport system ATP-binding protein
VLQGTGEFDELTVAEVVRHFSAFYADADDPDKVVEEVGLAGKAKAAAHTLSGGQSAGSTWRWASSAAPSCSFSTSRPPARPGVATGVLGADPRPGRRRHHHRAHHALPGRGGGAGRPGGRDRGGRLVEVAPPNRLGNRQEAVATVSWRTPDGAFERAESATPTALVAELAARYGGEVPGLTVTRPTLEDVYLRMIGHA